MSIERVEAALDSSPDPVVQSDESASPASGSTSTDIRSEMVEFAKQVSGEEDPEPAAEASAQPAEAKADAEAKEPESDEDEEAKAESGDDPEKPPKKSGWQKSKEKIAKLEADIAAREKRVAEFEERDSKWEHVSGLLQSRLEEAEERIANYESRLRELGAGPDPAERRIAELERRYREREAQLEQQQRELEQRARRDEEQRERQRITAIQAEVQRVADTHGLSFDELAIRAAGLSRAAKMRGQPAPRLDDVAAEMVALQRMKAGQSTERQVEVSRAAPSQIRGSAPSPTSPAWGTDVNGMTAYLKSHGLV